jgi:hypothetical protein
MSVKQPARMNLLHFPALSGFFCLNRAIATTRAESAAKIPS